VNVYIIPFIRYNLLSCYTTTELCTTQYINVHKNYILNNKCRNHEIIFNDEQISIFYNIIITILLKHSVKQWNIF